MKNSKANPNIFSDNDENVEYRNGGGNNNDDDVGGGIIDDNESLDESDFSSSDSDVDTSPEVTKKPPISSITKRRQTVDVASVIHARQENQVVKLGFEGVHSKLNTIITQLNTIQNSMSSSPSSLLLSKQSPSSKLKIQQSSLLLPIPSHDSPSPTPPQSSTIANKKDKSRGGSGGGGGIKRKITRVAAVDTANSKSKISKNDKCIQLYSIDPDFYLMCRKRQNINDGFNNLKIKFPNSRLVATWNNQNDVKLVGKAIRDNYSQLKWNARTNILTNSRAQPIATGELEKFIDEKIKF
jgi:hypothetical protein